MTNTAQVADAQIFSQTPLRWDGPIGPNIAGPNFVGSNYVSEF